MSKRKPVKKSAARRKKKQRFDIRQNIPILVLSVISAIMFIMIIIPPLKPVADSLWFTIIFRLLSCAWVLYFAFFHASAKKLPREGKAAMVLFAVMIWLGVLPERLTLIADVLIVLLQILLVTLSLIRRPAGMGPSLTAAFSVLILMWDQSNVSYLNYPHGLPFWPLSLFVTAAACAGYAILLHRGILKLKDNRRGERIAFVFLVGLFMLLAVSGSCSNLNRGLDDSEPMSRQARITDRQISTSRSGTDYYLDLELPEGSFSMNVNESDYKALENSDTIEIQYYQGAFGEPYFYLEPQD